MSLEGWRRSPTLTVLISIALVSASSALGLVIESPPSSTTRATTTTAIEHPSSTSAVAGMLMVDASRIYATHIDRVPDRSFAIVSSSGALLTPSVNDSGIFAVPLAPGNYALRVVDVRYQLAIPFRVFSGSETLVTLVLAEQVVSPLFMEVSDPVYPGGFTKNTSIVAEVFLPSFLIHENDDVFFELRGVPSSPGSGLVQKEQRAIITGVSSTGRVTLLQIHTSQQFEAGGLAGSVLVIYHPLYTVTWLKVLPSPSDLSRKLP